MAGRVQYVLLCEDKQHAAFVRRFLRVTRVIRDKRQIRVLGNGRNEAGDAFVLRRYPFELRAGRQGHVRRTLLVMIDGDSRGVQGRLSQLDQACREGNVDVRRDEDHVAIFVPTRNIETWLAYLDGEDVDEGRRNYPRLPRQRECSRHVAELAKMCGKAALREPVPGSLRHACEEYNSRVS